jgi:NAD(P)-dependent dehydrogenase (short-subunit alcohol dehydrogenase family)
VVLVTGTSSGFGLQTSLTLARQGHAVYAAMREVRGRNESAADGLRWVARDEGLDLGVVEIDVADDASAERGVAEVLDRAGRVDVLVNNAGIFYPALLETQTPEQVLAIFQTDAFGPLRMNRSVLPAMRGQGEGLVVTVTSGFGRVVLPFQGAYCGAKFAAEAMAEVSRYELAQYGVDVVIGNPGPTRHGFRRTPDATTTSTAEPSPWRTPNVSRSTASSPPSVRTSCGRRPAPTPRRSPTRSPPWSPRRPGGARFGRPSGQTPNRSTNSTRRPTGSRPDCSARSASGA